MLLIINMNEMKFSDNIPTFIDLFCGIGAFRLGFEKNNYKCIFSSTLTKMLKKFTMKILVKCLMEILQK